MKRKILILLALFIALKCLSDTLIAHTSISQTSNLDSLQNSGKKMNSLQENSSIMSYFENKREEESIRDIFQEFNNIINRQIDLVNLYVQISSWMFAVLLFFIGFYGVKGYNSLISLKSLQKKTEEKLNQIAIEIQNARDSVEIVKKNASIAIEEKVNQLEVEIQKARDSEEIVKKEMTKSIQDANIEINNAKTDIKNLLKVVYRLTQGDRYAFEGRYSKAENWYQRAKQIKPSIDIYFRMAKLYSDFGHYQKSNQLFEKELLKLPDLSMEDKCQTYILIARNFSKDGMNDRAIQYADKALEIYPDTDKASEVYSKNATTLRETALRTKGRCFLNEKNYEEAKKSFAAALELNKNNLNSTVNLSIAILCIGIVNKSENDKKLAKKKFLKSKKIIQAKKKETHEQETSFLLFYESLILLGLGIICNNNSKLELMLAKTQKAVEIEQYKKGVIQSYYTRYKLLSDISESSNKLITEALSIMESKLNQEDLKKKSL